VPYTVTVQAANAIGVSAASNSLTATPTVPETAPSVPLDLHGTSGNGAVTLSWVPPTNTGGTALTTSVVYATYGSGPSAGAFTQSVPGNGDTATITGLTNGTPYTFTVVANNAIGASQASTAVTVIPEAPSVLPPASTVSPPVPPPTVQQTVTEVAIPAGDTIEAGFGFANRDGATVDFHPHEPGARHSGAAP
jgi:hypothetical protein